MMARERAELEPDAATLGPQDVGALLREARTAKGMSVEDVATRLRLSSRVVRALEDGAFEALPAATYVRGYLRAYAKVVNIDGALLVGAYDHYAALPPEIDPYASAAEPQVEATDFPVRAVTYLVVVVLTGMIAIWLWQTHEGSSIGSLSMPKWGAEQSEQATSDSISVQVVPDTGARLSRETEPAAPASPVSATATGRSGDDTGVRVYSAPVPGDSSKTPDSVAAVATNATRGEAGAVSAALPEGPAEITQPPAAATAAQVGSGAASALPAPGAMQPQLARSDIGQPGPSDSDAAEITPAPLPPATPDGAQVLTLALSRDAWIEVMDARDRRLYYGLGRQGSRISVQGLLPYRVKIGNTGAVAVSYEGRPLDTTAFSSDSVARFKVTADGYLTGP